MPSPILFKCAVYQPKGPHWQLRQQKPPIAVVGPTHMHIANESFGFPGHWEFIDISKTTIIEQSTLLNLLLVSESFYQEVTPIYFGNNTFDFDNLGRCRDFLDRISPDARWQVGVFTHDPPPRVEK